MMICYGSEVSIGTGVPKDFSGINLRTTGFYYKDRASSKCWTTDLFYPLVAPAINPAI